ncbi:MAG: TonB-dependent receptor [Alphaproteobacteria bacterium]|nr:TonB-dependent receptor [Alphaproteobacteria bacterium]
MSSTNRLAWLLSASVAFLMVGGKAYAQQSPQPAPAEADSAADDDNNDIVVLAEPGDQIRIDRRTYTLRDDPVAQSTNMFDVLGRIPSVSVAPDGGITLLGAEGVQIQINGRPVPGDNLEQVLRGIPGGSVERIEVITNPSAQYAADASGGIINIITRRRFDAGFNGSIQTSADSLGGYHLGVSPSYSSGQWSFSGQTGVYGGEGDNNLMRERQTPPGGASTTEDGLRHFEYNGFYLSQLQAAFSPTERRRMSLSLDGGEHNFSLDQGSTLSNTLGPISTTDANSDNTFNNAQITFDFQQQGDAPRELIKFNSVLSQFTGDSRSQFAITPAGGGTPIAYSTRSEQDTLNFAADFDMEQPMPSDQFLTLGASFDYTDQTIDSALAPVGGAAPPAFTARLDGTSQTLAAYSTYQFTTGDWKWLPGVRVEGYRREVVSGALETDDTDVQAFPSLHIRNELTSHINVDLSYSSRIQRPGFEQLDPALRFNDANRAQSGNPNLEPMTTDAFEANLVYQNAGASFSVTFFDRITKDNWSQFTDVNGDGVIVTMPVNAGESEQRGLQALLRGPIGERWRYSLSGNVLNREYDFLGSTGRVRREAVEYDGIAQLDYRDEDQEATGANQYQFEVRFQGPRHGLQSERSEFVTANFTWRRRLTSRLFGVLNVQDIFDSADQVSEVTTDDYYERTEFESPGTRLRLALTYQFGSGPQRPPQDQQPGGPPMPQF